MAWLGKWRGSGVGYSYAGIATRKITGRVAHEVTGIPADPRCPTANSSAGFVRGKKKRFMDRSTPMSQADWLLALTKSQSKAAELFGRSEEEQRRLGYFHTLREICQQPWTWPRTCQVMLAVKRKL